MTPTKEQYELAAKAAGLKISFTAWTALPVLCDDEGFPSEWRPHEDRADAFSLLCALREFTAELKVGRYWGECKAVGTSSQFVREPKTRDTEAAAREAIFLCAVEVGRGLA